MPWQEKRYSQIIIELSRGVFPMRPGNMRDNRWNLVQECWSWDPEDRPGCAEVLKRMDSCALEEYRGRPRNVVLYGENWSGQLSLINLIMGREAAITSHTSYDVMISGQYFRLWDTLGLDEGLEGTVPAAKTEKNLTAFLRGIDQEDGVHLLIYCVHGARAIGALQTNYKIFSSVIAGSKVPTVIVATCLEYFRGDMSAWWNRNEDTLARYGMQFSGYACVTTLRDDPAESLDIHERRAQSYKDICELILNKCLQAPP
ncbi:hypothetical protein M405DRAFT_123569 [Rhizopogon salebrosus TDB-379]|nr:hypothetical protein M405DRAFT_123569 [Rhizopogon salebrosus TDB-379]